MPTVDVTKHTRDDGSLVIEVDVSALDVRADETGEDGRRLRYFDFGPDAPVDAVSVVVAQLRGELPVAASEPPQTTTVEL